MKAFASIRKDEEIKTCWVVYLDEYNLFPLPRLDCQCVQYMSVSLVGCLPNAYSLVAGVRKAVRLNNQQEVSNGGVIEDCVHSLRYDESRALGNAAFCDAIMIACTDADTTLVVNIDHHAKIRVAVRRASV